MMEEVLAKLKQVPMSAQKARLVADQVRGLPVARALDILSFSPKKAANFIKNILKSAIANAENNNNLDVDMLKISTIFVDEGIVMKRLKYRARGRADRTLKRTCNITVKVAEVEEK